MQRAMGVITDVFGPVQVLCVDCDRPDPLNPIAGRCRDCHTAHTRRPR